MHPICPPKILHRHCFQSLTAVIPRRNEKQRLCKFRGGGGQKRGLVGGRQGGGGGGGGGGLTVYSQIFDRKQFAA